MWSRALAIAGLCGLGACQASQRSLRGSPVEGIVPADREGSPQQPVATVAPAPGPTLIPLRTTASSPRRRGSPIVPPPPPCHDTNGGAVDMFSNNCSWYYGIETACGSFDTDSFRTFFMCCSCGGGASSPPVPTPTPGPTPAPPCYDTNVGALDMFSEDCSWYDGIETACGSFDTGSFRSFFMCCSCGGGSATPPALTPAPAPCHDTNRGFLDLYQDGCSWYFGKEHLCGRYDDTDFKAKEMCCSCGGGSSTSPAPTPPWAGWVPAPAPTPASTLCYDTNDDAVDSLGDGCTSYDGVEASCGWFDTPDFNATEMCCSCGGGSATPPAPTPAPAPCYDTNAGALNHLLQDCSLYVGDAFACSAYDTQDFSALEMCCGCGGGSATPPAPTPAPALCYDTNGDPADSGGDGCGWYDGVEALCGWFDTSDFNATEMCCSCGGGASSPPVPTPAPGPTPAPPPCQDVDNGAVDYWDNSCSWYRDVILPDFFCGMFDAEGFDAEAMCCGCGGGA